MTNAKYLYLQRAAGLMWQMRHTKIAHNIKHLEFKNKEGVLQIIDANKIEQWLQSPYDGSWAVYG